MSKRFLPIGLALFATFFVSACSRPQPGQQDSGESARGKPRTTLNIGNGSEPEDLDPQVVTGVPEHKILMGLFEGLLTEDPHDLHPVPGVAERWEVSPDGLVYTFHLRPDARWSNGRPLTAEDFVASYQRMLTPVFAAKYSYMLWYVVNAQAYNEGKITDFSQVGFKALDPHTLQVTLVHRTPFLLQLIASHYSWYPVPIATIAKFGGLTRKNTKWTQAGNLVSNGPYVLKEWLPNQRIVIARNPEYWDARHVKLDEIRFYPVSDLASEERMFRTGQLDITSTLPIAKIDLYRREHPKELHIDPYLGVYYYRLNVTRPPLNDVRVRRALALSIDRESLVKYVLRGGQRPAYAISYPGVDGYTAKAHLSYDVAEARRLLAEAGYPDGKGWPHVELLYNTSEDHRIIAEAIQQMWRKNLGINITLTNQEWKVYLDSQANSNYWIARAGWIADYISPNTFLDLWTTGNLNNQTGWSDPAYDRLAAAALAAPTQEERYADYQQMDALIVQQVPVIPIYYYTRIYAMNPKIRGYWPTLLDDHPYKYIYWEN